MTLLKQEWDEAKGNLKRVCKVCNKSFKPAKWNQTLCTDSFCKQGVFLYSHFQASLRRWETWKNEMKDREEYNLFLKGK